jgi:hypothetical protein
MLGRGRASEFVPKPEHGDDAERWSEGEDREREAPADRVLDPADERDRRWW